MTPAAIAHRLQARVRAHQHSSAEHCTTGDFLRERRDEAAREDAPPPHLGVNVRVIRRSHVRP
jgi:hypothetical protein